MTTNLDKQQAESRPFGELRERGLLWLINTSVFHPRGLAMALHYGDDDPDLEEPTGWSLLAAGPDEAFDYAPSVDIDECFRQAEATMRLYVEGLL